MDRWGRCDECGRWFYMPKPGAVCPVCQNQPSAVVDRDEEPATVEAGEDPAPSAG